MARAGQGLALPDLNGYELRMLSNGIESTAFARHGIVDKAPIAIQLRTETSSNWWRAVSQDFDRFLVDHAACERKASATGVQFVCKYPEKTFLIDPMIRFAREELLHFHQVSRLLLERKIQHAADERDPYVNELLKLVRTSRNGHFLDRLLIFALIEKRGTERFGIVAKNVQDRGLQRFYSRLTEAESRHHELFIEIARHYYDDPTVERRLREFEEIEAQLIQSLPIRAAVH